jgi:anaerobic magnesium-protoporphyrin IX monomethyl ester cyclase
MKPSLNPGLYVVANETDDRHWMDVLAGQSKTPVTTNSALPRFTIVVGPSPFSMPRGWEFFLCSPYEGVSYIATVLHNAGYPVRIVDVRYARDPLGQAYREVLEGTDVLGIATFEDNYPFCEDLIAEVKAARPNMPIVLGGSLVTSVPHVFMNETAADVAVISEGEITILELMEAYARGDVQRRLPSIRGIWWKGADGAVHENPPRGQMESLDALPPMNLGLWPQARDPRGMQPQIIASYSRGCKMDCSFCYRTTPQERTKSPDVLARDLAYYKKNWGIDFVFFVDLTFTAHKKSTMQYLDVIEDHDLRWTCLTRNADVDAEICKKMGDAGCDIALYGVESLSPEVLKEARKGSSENIVLRAMKHTWDAGVRYGGLTIVGLPGETEVGLDHMCQWAEENNHITRVKYLSAMPGTTVYQQGVASGIIRSEVEHLRWLSIEQALERDEFLSYNDLSDSVMRRAYKRLYDSYQPGPVMDFRHFPEHFSYYDPDPNPSRPWRGEFSSAGGVPYPQSERYRGLKPASPGVDVQVRPGEIIAHA